MIFTSHDKIHFHSLLDKALLKSVMIILMLLTITTLASELSVRNISSLQDLALKVYVHDHMIGTLLSNDELPNFIIEKIKKSRHSELALQVAIQARLPILLSQRIPIHTSVHHRNDGIVLPNMLILDNILPTAIQNHFIDNSQTHKATLHQDSTFTIYKKRDEGWEAQKTFAGHLEKINHIAWSPDSSLIASCSPSEKKIKIWDTHNGDCLYTIQYPNEFFMTQDMVKFSNNAILSRSNTIKKQETLWHIPWMNTSLHDMLLMKTLLLSTTDQHSKTTMLSQLHDQSLVKHFI